MAEHRDRGRTHRAQDAGAQMDTQRIFIAPPSPELSTRPVSLNSPRLSPAGSGRSQPEGSSGSRPPLPVGQLSIRPLAPVGSSAPDRSQPEGSLRLHPVGSQFSPKDESGRSQPEGSCPGLLSPTHQYRPLPPSPSSPHRSPAPSPRGSPQLRRSQVSPRPITSQEPCVRSDSNQPSQVEVDKPSFNGADLSKAGEDFRVYIITWNVGCSVPPSDLTGLLCLNAGDGKTDMFVIGLQEVNSMINKRLKDALFSDQWSEVFMDVLSPFSYVLVSSVRMQGVLLMVFAKYFHLPYLRDIQTDCTRTGLGGYWGNKGGVSIRLSLFGHMVCFLNCHLPAHMENSDQRVDNFESILQLQQFQGPLANGVLDHDLVFWFGDLNFRIDDLDLYFVKSAIQGNKLSLLWEKDQLNMAKCCEPVLSGFLEGPLTFSPTYKYDVGTNIYDTSSKKRKPAWTDRILWKMKNPLSQSDTSSSMSEGLSVTLLSYGSHMQYTESDHKPVSAIFSVKFSACLVAPLVHLSVPDEWMLPADACVTYQWSPIYMKSSWDWIGLYKVGFRHHKDYVSYIWVKTEDDTEGMRYQHQVMFSEESLPRGTGEYLLGYYSNNMSTLIGVTEPFQISLPGSEPSSDSDSSDSSSDEDNSTQVLLRPESRSPSPANARSPRSRSPALARLHDLIIPGSSRQKSRSPSPCGAKSPKQERPPRSRSRDTTREHYGNKVHSSLASQTIAVPSVRPAAMGQGFSPKGPTTISPNSLSKDTSLTVPPAKKKTDSQIQGLEKAK